MQKAPRFPGAVRMWVPVSCCCLLVLNTNGSCCQFFFLPSTNASWTENIPPFPMAQLIFEWEGLLYQDSTVQAVLSIFIWLCVLQSLWSVTKCNCDILWVCSTKWNLGVKFNQLYVKIMNKKHVLSSRKLPFNIWYKFCGDQKEKKMHLLIQKDIYASNVSTVAE